VGQDALIYNTGGVALTVKTFGGASTIVSIPSTGGAAQYIFITSNANTSGTWGVIAFGSTTTNSNAATLAGYGLKAIGATLNQSQPVTTFSSNYTAVAADRANTYVWTGGAGTLTLTSASTLGDDWFFLVRNGGTGTLAVTPAGGLINGSASLDLQPSDSCLISSSGTAFYSVGLGKSTQFNFTKAVTAAGSPYTLTSSEAANVIQKYTGTLSGNVVVNLPQTIQVYYITNQTTGAYTITFQTGVSGGATAVVPAGQQVILLCDSVNLYNASTIAAGAVTLALANGSVGAPSLSFSSEGTTGIYRPASGEFGISILGSQVLDVTAAGIIVTGTAQIGTGVTGGIAGGTFV
jgi:hypothetical protein